MNGVFKSILRINDSVNSFYFGYIVSCLFVMVTFIQGKHNKLSGLFQMYKYKCTPLPGDSR